MCHQSRKFYSEEQQKAQTYTYKNKWNYMVEQYQLYTLLYKWVFNIVLNDWKESQHLISRGNEFQRVGAATENARSPSVEEVLGMASK